MPTMTLKILEFDDSIKTQNSKYKKNQFVIYSGLLYEVTFEESLWGSKTMLKITILLLILKSQK